MAGCAHIEVGTRAGAGTGAAAGAVELCLFGSGDFGAFFGVVASAEGAGAANGCEAFFCCSDSSTLDVDAALSP